MHSPPRRPRAPLAAAAILAGLLAASCSAPDELTGAAAARSRGAAAVPGAEPAPEGEGSAVRAEDPWLDDLKVLARVNGKVITLREVRHAIGPVYDQLLKDRDQLARLVDARLRRMIEVRLVVAEGRRRGLKVKDDDFDRAVQRTEKVAAERRTTLEQTIKDRGMTRREWEETLRDEIVFARASDLFAGRYPDWALEEPYRPLADTTVRPEEVRAYGRRHPEIASVPESATVRLIDLRKDRFAEGGTRTEDEAWDACGKAMDAVEARLRAGEEFGKVATEVSQGEGADKGGLLEPFGRDSSRRREVVDWAFAPERRPGDLSPRIRIPTGFLLLLLEKREQAHAAPIEEWGPKVRTDLEELKQEAAYEEAVARLLEDASIAPPDLRDSLLSDRRARLRELREKMR